MKSLEELRAIREKMQGKVGFRSEDATQTRVVVGMATCGIASGARPVLAALADAYRKSKKDSGTNRINRRTGLKPEKLYPQYRQNSGEPAEISAFNTAAEDRRKMGFVTMLKSISEIAPYVPFGKSKE